MPVDAHAGAPGGAPDDADSAASDSHGSAEAGGDHEMPGVIQSLKALFASGREIGGEVGELAALEVRLAAVSGIRMLAAGIILALSGAAAWALLQATFAVVLVGYYAVSLAAVLGGLAVANLLLCLFLGLALRRLARHLTFAGTRRVVLSRGQAA